MFYTGERSMNLFINVTFLFETFEFLTTNPLKWLQKYILTHIHVYSPGTGAGNPEDIFFS